MLTRPLTRLFDRPLPRLLARCRKGGDGGMVTAEYAVGAVAAVAFAYVLYKIVNSGPVSSALSAVIRKALDVQF
jgi:Protein of unknown function (DUF4244)